MTTKAFRAGKRAPNTVFELSGVSALAGLNGDYDGQQVSLAGWHPNSTVGGGTLIWNPTRAKSDHNGGTVFSPTVPWTTTTADYLNGVGETDPAGLGAWERVKQSNVLEFDTVDQMINLGFIAFDDQTIFTRGYLAAGDGGAAVYRVLSSGVADQWSEIQMLGGRFAVIQPQNNSINNKQAGIFPDGNIYTQRMLDYHNYCKEKGLVCQYIYSNQPIRTELFRTQDQVVIGNSKKPVTISLAYDGSNPVTGQFRSGSYVDGFSFESESSDLSFQRTGIEQASNVKIKNSNFIGFRNPVAKNAWGIYIANATNVVIEDCGFDDNSQSDFAVVDNCSNISIIRPRALNSILYGNIEPNGNLLNDQIFISDCHLTLMYLLTNTRTSNPGTNVVFRNCKIDELIYDGTDATFIGCDFDVITRESQSIVYAGSLDFINCNLSFGANKVIDHRLAVAGDTAGNWITSFSNVTPADRYSSYISDSYRGLTINPNSTNGTIQIKSNNDILVSPSSTYIFTFSGFCETGVTGFNSFYARVRFLDVSDVEIETINVGCFRVGSSSSSEPRIESVILNTPVNAAKAVILLRNGDNDTDNKVTFFSVTANKITKSATGAKGDFGSVLNLHGSQSLNVHVHNSIEYKSDFTYRIGMLTGDKVTVGTTDYVLVNDSTFNGPHFVGTWESFTTAPA